MKHFAFLLSVFLSVNAFALPNPVGIHLALKNPSSITVLTFSGEKDEAGLFVKNAKSFSSLNQIIISNLSDSVSVEQNIIAVAACSGVYKLNFENCGIRNFSGALKMLVSVKEVEISNCKKLSADAAFSALAEMPSLLKMNFQTEQLIEIPRSFFRLRTLDRITISNNDLSLADGYALNNFPLQSLLVSDSITLGFGSGKLVVEYHCYDKFSAKSHLCIMRDLLQGVAGMDGKIILPQRAIAFNRANALIHPPIAGLDVWKNIYTTNATVGGEIDYPSGTRIYIPENAFVDANGNQVRGDVMIDYREFRDQVDIMLSGIPMDYDSGGAKRHFVSAGMFEMNASVNGQEVFLAKGKNVNMKFAVVDTANNFNFYRLDEKKGWEYLNSPGKVETENDEKITPALWAYYDWNRALFGVYSHPFQYDSTDFDSRYNDSTYYYTFKIGSGGAGYGYQLNANSIHLTKVYHKKSTLCFRIARSSGSSANEELSAFDGVAWKTTDTLSRKEMMLLFSRYGSGANDMRIYQNGGIGFTLEFKTESGFKRIHAVPVRVSGGKTMEYSLKMQNSMFEKYSVALMRRKNEVNDDADNGRIYYRSGYQMKFSVDSISYWKRLRPKMNKFEMQLDFSGWSNYYRTQLPKIKEEEPRRRIYKDKKETFSYTPYLERQSSFKGVSESNVQGSYCFDSTQIQWGARNRQYQAIFQALTINKFGVYNCDRCENVQNAVITNATFNVKQLSNPIISSIYLLDKDVNTSTNFCMGVNAISITYNSKHQNTLISVDNAGRLLFTNANDFAHGTGSGVANTRYSAELITTQPATPEQLKELISGAQ